MSASFVVFCLWSRYRQLQSFLSAPGTRIKQASEALTCPPSDWAGLATQRLKADIDFEEFCFWYAQGSRSLDQFMFVSHIFSVSVIQQILLTRISSLLFCSFYESSRWFKTHPQKRGRHLTRPGNSHRWIHMFHTVGEYVCYIRLRFIDPFSVSDRSGVE